MKTPALKRVGAIFCALTMALTLHTPAWAGETEVQSRSQWAEVSLFDESRHSFLPARSRQIIHIRLDGAELDGDVPAFLLEERTLFPLRLVSEALGATVEWRSKARQAVVTAEDRELVFTMGSPVALVNGEEMALPDGVSPCLALAMGEERTMVPLRFLAEWLDFGVSWEDATRTVYLTPGQGEGDLIEEPQPLEKPLAGFRVALDAGHGGHSPGAVYEGVYEKDINLPIVLRSAELLREKGCEVLLTRGDDTFVDLYDRSYMANDANVDIFVSVHSNASETNPDFQGTFTYFFPGSQKGEELARVIQSAVAGTAGSMDQGLLSENFVVLRETHMPAVLVETGFMSCHEELTRLCDPDYREKLAQGVARGVEDYLTAHVLQIEEARTERAEAQPLEEPEGVEAPVG